MVPDLLTLMAHENDDVSRSAAKLLGRFPDPRASTALKQTIAQGQRVRMRGVALASLGRMRDSEAATLALAALSDPNDYMKAAGVTALGLIGASRNAEAVLRYLDAMAANDILDTGAFDILAELGDPPGSTAVRDRLLAEASKKTNDLSDRLDAAVALKKMGLEHLVTRILDRQKAEVTNSRLIVLRGLMSRLAIERGIEHLAHLAGPKVPEPVPGELAALLAPGSSYYDDVAFFRVIQNFMVRFGIHGDSAVSGVWREAHIPDDPVTQSNRRGMLTYAAAGPGTRTTQPFVNFRDNTGLDGQGFAPFGRVIEGLSVVDLQYSGYREGAPRGTSPERGRAQAEGNAYLKRAFPKLDFVKTARVKP